MLWPELWWNHPKFREHAKVTNQQCDINGLGVVNLTIHYLELWHVAVAIKPGKIELSHSTNPNIQDATQLAIRPTL